MVKPPFEFLRHADPRQVLNFLSGEHPQTIALVLAHMKAEQSSLVLGSLPEDLQREVSVRIATLDQTSPDVVTQVEQVVPDLEAREQDTASRETSRDEAPV